MAPMGNDCEKLEICCGSCGFWYEEVVEACDCWEFSSTTLEVEDEGVRA